MSLRPSGVSDLVDLLQIIMYIYILYNVGLYTIMYVCVCACV